MIPLDEWLPQAKKLAVGQSKRVRHNLELTCAMNVSNKVDRYVAYCQRCKTGAVHMKDFVNLTQKPIDQSSSRHRGVPKDAVLLSTRPDATQSRVWSFLMSKGIADVHVPTSCALWYSASDDRVIFRSKGSPAMGRALGAAQPKWLDYEEGAWWSTQELQEGQRYVLVEDVLSAIKVQYALDKYKGGACTVVCCHGTSIRPALMEKLLHADGIVIMLDGDNAGEVGTVRMYRELTALGLRNVSRVHIPYGCDPKDLRIQEIVDLKVLA